MLYVEHGQIVAVEAAGEAPADAEVISSRRSSRIFSR